MVKLYRIKRLSDGKFLSGWWYPIGREAKSNFNRTGQFFKGADTIKRHLHRLCCDWLIYGIKRYGDFEMACVSGYWGTGLDIEKVEGPYWDRLDLYEVDILVVLDSETIKQPAKDFMGILEDA